MAQSPNASVIDQPTLDRIAAGAEAADQCFGWPSASWDSLRAAGALGWLIPREYGGAGLGPVELLRANEALAGACLTTAFVLSQRDAAVRRLMAGPESLRRRYLPRLSLGETFLTVGVSQLTTSRQHGGPALRARPTGSGGYLLDGEAPWVTGADRAEAVVVGAVLADGAQLLVVLPTDLPGVSVGPPTDLAALRSSRTAVVRCDGADVGPESVLAGPGEQVLGRSGGGGLETSCLALGLADAATGYLAREAEQRPELAGTVGAFRGAVESGRARLHEQAALPATPDGILAARVECTRLALRATQAALVVAKGSGFVIPHPAQRWSRQALFFLVWSCPRPVAEGVLADLTPERFL